MNCDPQSLLNAARCFACIPKGTQKEIWIYLLCRVVKLAKS